MTARRPATAPFSADAIGETDLPRVDAHVVQPEEYEDLPELTDAMMARADHYVGDRLVRRGRPSRTGARIGAKAGTTTAVSIRLSPAVLAHFRGSGPGWQARIDEILRKVVEAERSQRADGPKRA